MASRRFRLIQQRVIFEDNHVLIYDKPSGLRVQPCPSHPSLHDEIKYFLSTKYSKKGNVYLGVVHRLDRLTSGGIILAKTSKAASRLSESMRNNQIKKHYLAIVHGSLSLKQKSCEDYINDQMNPVKILSYQSYQKMRLSDPNIERDFKYSSASISPICSFQALYSSPPISPSSTTLPSSACTALSVELQTGRKHQIRVQLSSRGHPILGDTKYHAPRNYHISPTGATPGLIGLHSYEVSFPHPTTKQMITVRTPLPLEWKGTFMTAETLDIISSQLESQHPQSKSKTEGLPVSPSALLPPSPVRLSHRTNRN